MCQICNIYRLTCKIFAFCPFVAIYAYFCDFRGKVQMITDYMGGGCSTKTPKSNIWMTPYSFHTKIFLPGLAELSRWALCTPG